MTMVPTRGGRDLAVTMTLGYLLTVVPLPEGWSAFRPDWVALLCIYWLLTQPGRIGLMTVFMLGLLLDTLKGQLLGQHALALIVTAYLVLKTHLRMRVFPLGQQTVSVILVLLVYQFMLFWVDGVAGEPLNWPRRWLPLASDALAWPMLVILLGAWRQDDPSQ